MKRKLDLGCGLNKLAGAIGVDSNPDATAADLIADLNCPLPFPDGSFDSIRAVHVIEHVNDIMQTMAEIHRVARGLVKRMKRAQSRPSLAGPRPPAWREADYFCAGPSPLPFSRRERERCDLARLYGTVKAVPFRTGNAMKPL